MFSINPSDFEVLKLGLDLVLIISLVYLCLKIFKGETANTASGPNVLALEGSLRSVIRESEEAGRLLNDQLLKRQRGLEQVLFEVETVEHRINRAVLKAEETRGLLDIELAKAKTLEPRYAQAAATARPDEVLLSEREPLQSEVKPSAARSQPVRPNAAPRQRLNQALNQYQQNSSKPRAQYNVYGDEIGAPTPGAAAEPLPRARLSAAIEKEIKPEISGSDKALQKLYDAAENMLRAGQDLRTVAEQTDLPYEEVVKLGQILAAEKRQQRFSAEEEFAEQPPAMAARSEPAADPRLGVLASMRRQTQVL
jgi:hypothetical protein